MTVTVYVIGGGRDTASKTTKRLALLVALVSLALTLSIGDSNIHHHTSDSVAPSSSSSASSTSASFFSLGTVMANTIGGDCDSEGAVGTCLKMADCPDPKRNNKPGLCGDAEDRDQSVRCCYAVPDRDDTCVAYTCSKSGLRRKEDADTIVCDLKATFDACSDERCCEQVSAHVAEKEEEKDEGMPLYGIILLAILGACVLGIGIHLYMRHVNYHLRKRADITNLLDDKRSEAKAKRMAALEELYPDIPPPLREHYHKKELQKDKKRFNHILGNWDDQINVQDKVWNSATGCWEKDRPDTVYTTKEGNRDLTRVHNMQR